jgi:hypothetical protein
MDQNYLCPKCGGHLSICDHIVFIAKKANREKGIILLHAEIGNYTSEKHQSFVFEDGESLDFCCPLCHASLACDFDDNLSHLIMEEGGQSYDIYFSRIAGEKSTYQVNGNTVYFTGEHAHKYTWFKLDDKYKQYLSR